MENEGPKRITIDELARLMAESFNDLRVRCSTRGVNGDAESQMAARHPSETIWATRNTAEKPPAWVSNRMNRRDFITLLGGAVALRARTLHAQQKAVQVVGLLNGSSPASYALFVAALHQGLREAGYVWGQ